MVRARSLFAFAALALVVTTTSLAHATVVVPLTLADQVHQADLVVRVRVRAMHSAYVPERGTILTWTELEVTDVLKGQAGSTLMLRQMGGTADGQTMLVPGDAHLSLGQDVVMFLRTDPNGTSDVFLLSLAQSAWVVNGQEAARDLSQLSYAILAPDGTRISEPGSEPSLGVDSLLAQIRSLVGGAR